MTKALFFFISLMVLSSCVSHTEHSAPAAQEKPLRSPQSLDEFMAYLPRIKYEVFAPEHFNQETCIAFISKYSEVVFNRPSGYFFPKNQTEIDSLNAYGETLLINLFGLRQILQNRLTEFQNPSPECVNSVRKAVRYTRFAEDSLVEWMGNQKPIKVQNKLFSGGLPMLLTADDDVSQQEIQTGDLLLMRGQSYISAMIARIGDEDAEFSHIAIVGEDDKGKKYVVEALIETGTIIHSLEDYLEKKVTRIAVYRNPDRELARKAGLFIYQEARKAQVKTGQNIPYDFAMDPNDHKNLFCAEVIQYAYEQASGGALILPRFKTSFRQIKNTTVPKALGMNVEETFAPVDIEFDGRFKLIKEYRHLPSLRKSRIQDAVLTSVYEWMENQGYELRFDLSTNIKASSVWGLRQLGFVKDKMPKNMNTDTLKLIFKFETITTALEKNLSEIEDQYFKTHGYSMTFKDFLDQNEQFRQKDCELEKKYSRTVMRPDQTDRESSTFHWLLSNKECSR